ncbi:MAG: 5-amino-6-(D-ribitylamino)uracil--L-tyrosine 4-hydroxyphenyl transferase CofH [bacterium]|nr:5-amino-6-(D-ribitylamino)uracil--L-tyrosine 4-hydroxyphenyl transferase CofH [bacterium]
MSAPQSLSEKLLRGTDHHVHAALEKSLEGRELSQADAATLLGARGRDLQILCAVADSVRQDDVGDEVSYVVCRNINFTNICYVGCKFCGFSRHKHNSDAYERSIEEILERAHEAWKAGASELCLQGGIHPNKDGFWYAQIIGAIKAELPNIHLHALSPEEIHFGVQKSNGMSLRDYLSMLKDEGLGTMPGTAAEILDDGVRKIISPKKLMTDRWVEIITTAHELGIRSSSTLLYGHIETPQHVAKHLDLLRDIQKNTGGFTEFVPLGFVHHQTKLYRNEHSRAGASMQEDLALLATARLFLRPYIKNVQISWVKMGFKLGQVGLMSGANDFGGTLMEESISNAAGSEHGDHVEVPTIRRLIREIARIPYERTTTYGRRATPATEATAFAELELAQPQALFATGMGSGY